MTKRQYKTRLLLELKLCKVGISPKATATIIKKQVKLLKKEISK